VPRENRCVVCKEVRTPFNRVGEGPRIGAK
jgi:hypothetical protein